MAKGNNIYVNILIYNIIYNITYNRYLENYKYSFSNTTLLACYWAGFLIHHVLEGIYKNGLSCDLLTLLMEKKIKVSSDPSMI